MLVRAIPAAAVVTAFAVTLTVAPEAQASNPMSGIEGTGLMSTSTGTFNPRGQHQDPYLHISPSFRFEYQSAEISREAPCVPNRDYFRSTDDGSGQELAAQNPRVQFDETNCSTPTIVNRREMDFRSTRSILDLGLRTGARGIELRLNFPLVISSSNSLRYAQRQVSSADTRVTQSNSTVDPSDQDIRREAERAFGGGQSFVGNLDRYQMYRFMDLSSEYSAYERRGFADPTVGIRWSPWNDYLDDTKATMWLGLDYTMPVTRIREAGNTAVGRGVHELLWTVGASKKFGWIEPYFSAEYLLPLARSNSLFGAVDPQTNTGQGQVVTSPPMQGFFTVGTELIPYENPDQGTRIALDVQFRFGYTGEGRDYTPLFDHMTDPNNECNGVRFSDVQPVFDDNGALTNPREVACAWVLQQPSNSTGRAEYDLSEVAPDRTFAFTDLATVDSYGTFGLQLGASIQPRSIFQFRTNFGVTHHQAHLLTNARTGSTGGVGAVSMTDGTQRNPAYNPTYDNSGDRFRMTRANTWHFMTALAVQF